MDFPVVKNPLASEGDVRALGLGRSPGEGNGNPLQYSCLENPMNRGAWEASVYGVAKESAKTECACVHATDSSYLKSTEGFGIPRFSRCIS